MKIRKTDHLGLIRLGLALLVVSPVFATEFYVAAGGSDAKAGTLTNPFATLERARDEVRKLVAAGLKEDVTVFIRGGTYLLARAVVFGLADSGTRDHTITYAAYPGETPVFSGGVKVNGWRKLADSAALPPAAQGKVWVTDLPETNGQRRLCRGAQEAGGRSAAAAGQDDPPPANGRGRPSVHGPGQEGFPAAVRISRLEIGLQAHRPGGCRPHRRLSGALPVRTRGE